MKMIIAVIQPVQLRAVKDALSKVGVERITICDSQEYADVSPRDQLYRNTEYQPEILRKITLEIAVNDDFLERTLETLRMAAKKGTHGSVGDGKIFVINLEQAIQFHPETRGPGAI